MSHHATERLRQAAANAVRLRVRFSPNREIRPGVGQSNRQAGVGGQAAS